MEDVTKRIIMKLYDLKGQRLYLTSNEREAFIEAAKNAPREIRTFWGFLHIPSKR